ncbi:MAG: hypothetical protein DME33_07940 [Verrucomicrobia bacterium]|nr:MAG: hypothetical protein DME87_10755 [Verrucomicrobiota bacterium]PYL08190.1 MAG: hypothetical protein DME33_07940 [Verrucomicrobiota bacterium]
MANAFTVLAKSVHRGERLYNYIPGKALALSKPCHSKPYWLAAGVKFCLTSRWASVCLLRITKDAITVYF